MVGITRADTASKAVRISSGDRSRVEVWDKDVRYDDLIGKYDFVLTPAMVRSGGVTMRFGQVRQLLFELRPAR